MTMQFFLNMVNCSKEMVCNFVKMRHKGWCGMQGCQERDSFGLGELLSLWTI